MNTGEKKIEDQLNELLMGQYTSNEVSKSLISKLVDIGNDLGELRKKGRTSASLPPEMEKRLESMEERLMGLGELVTKVLELERTARRAMENTTNQLLTGQEGLIKDIDQLRPFMEALRAELDAHRQLFERPLHKEVHYRHFVGKPLWWLAGGVVVVCVVARLWYTSTLQADRCEGNDLRWRFVSLSHDSTVQHTMEKADAQYKADPAAFRKGVEQEETRRQDLAEKWMQMQETQQSIEELNKEEKKR